MNDTIKIERAPSTFAVLSPDLDGIDAPIFAVRVIDHDWAPFVNLGDVLTCVAGWRAVAGDLLAVERGDMLFLAQFGFAQRRGDEVLGVVEAMMRDIGPAEDRSSVFYVGPSSVLDSILSEAAVMWTRWRKKNPDPDAAGAAYAFTKHEEMSQADYYERRRIADVLTPNDLPSLLAIAADERVWRTAAHNGEHTPAECIRDIVSQLTYEAEDAIDD